MIERCRRVSLAEEPRLRHFVEAVRRVQKLQRYGSPEMTVFRAVDHAHAAGSDRLADLKMRNRASRESERIRRGSSAREKRSIDVRELRAGPCVRRQERLDGSA
jgi:hypothetical protein